MSYPWEPDNLMVFREVVFEKVRLAAQMHLEPEAFLRNHLTVGVLLDQVSQRLVLDMRSFVLGNKAERVDVEEKWPADWWQAFRERWLPAWWLKRHPVKYRMVSIHKDIWRVCPHVDVKCPEGPRVHFQYLEGKTPNG